MSRMWCIGLLPLVLAAAAAQAKDPKPADAIPAPSNIRGAEYPRIDADLRVTFRIKAPDAQKVEFKFVGGTAVSRAEGRGWLLDRDHDTAGAGIPLLRAGHRWRAGQ